MKKLKAAVIVFNGSNCDKDAYYALKLTGFDTEFVWHEENKKLDYDLVFIPGGFSYGDYLRAGALAKFSHIMDSVRDFVSKQRGLLLGICNGFQILTETKILKGTLSKNEHGKFICKNVEIEIVNRNTPFTKYIPEEIKSLTIPIAHAEGRYYADKETLKYLYDNNMIAFKYKNNPNGSIENIAGIYNEKYNILGMMPHPERQVAFYKKKKDGLLIFYSIKKYILNEMK